jgi:hypothetical protein
VAEVNVVVISVTNRVSRGRRHYWDHRPLSSVVVIVIIIGQLQRAKPVGKQGQRAQRSIKLREMSPPFSICCHCRGVMGHHYCRQWWQGISQRR